MSSIRLRVPERSPADMARSGATPTDPRGRAHHGADDQWPSQSGAPVLCRMLCSLAQPCLAHPQSTRSFRFFEATLLLVRSGSLTLDDGTRHLRVDTPSALVMVEQHVCTDLIKRPAEDGTAPFSSVFLTLSPSVIAAFYRAYPTVVAMTPPLHFGGVSVDEDLAVTLEHCLQSIEESRISDERLLHRLLDLLLALSERGYTFACPLQQSTSERLRIMFSADPGRRWTAREAGRELAMSVATLGRRLAAEGVRFDELLVDVRMHHAMLLMQTTRWSIPQIVEACGYKSRARFVERFRERFGSDPGGVR